MSAIQGVTTAHRRQGRRWHFGPAVFDEPSWTLVVDGRRVTLESKPMDLLHELLLRAGEVVAKHELLDAIWPGVSVVEASLPTAMMKLRKALDDRRHGDAMIETVPRIGYRLAVPVRVESPPSARGDAPPLSGDERFTAPVQNASTRRGAVRWMVAGCAILLVAIISVYVASSRAVIATPVTGSGASQAPLPQVAQIQASSALRKLDVEAIEGLLAQGWDPNTPYNAEGDGALNMLLNVCEWDPNHDKRRLLIMARTLLEGGAKLDHRNNFGDTAYSIASAPRYCGPDHPVSQMLLTLCNSSYGVDSGRCRPTYAEVPGTAGSEETHHLPGELESPASGAGAGVG